MSKIIFNDNFREDLRFLKKENRKLLVKVLELIENTSLTPFEGLGKPEPLKGNYQRYWSRRIDQKHRFVYSFNEENDEVTLVSCYGHYDDK